MIRSMTGYGRGEASGSQWHAVVELTSVNRKQLDFTVPLPRELLFAESQIRDVVRGALSRGSVKGNISLFCTGSGKSIDASLFAAKVEAMRKVARELGLEDDLKASHLMMFPEWSECGSLPEKCEDALDVVLQALRAALDGLRAMREKEGAALCADLKSRIGQLRGLHASIGEKAPKVPERHAEAMKRRLGEWAVEPAGVESSSIAREIALFADRCDVSEELTRLESHFGQFEQLLESEEACGRKLDFLCQEMMREINTTGSKANDILISSDVIEFKAILETVREQVQNIE